MDANTYFKRKLILSNGLLAALEAAYDSFDALQRLEGRFAEVKGVPFDPDVRALGQDLLDLLGNAEAFRDAVAPLARAAARADAGSGSGA